MSLPVYHDRDCDLSIICASKVLVIGYGSQGRTQALNARDSGVTQIKVALKPNSKTRAKAEADGFEVVAVAKGVQWADVLVILTSDEAHQKLFNDEINPYLRPGQSLIFAHGLSCNFGLVTPPADVDVLLVSPKGIGPRIRDIYVAGEESSACSPFSRTPLETPRRWGFPLPPHWAAAARAFWKLP